MVGKKILFNYAAKKGKEFIADYVQKQDEKSDEQPTSNAQNDNKGYGWGKQPSPGYGWGKQPSSGTGSGYQQTTLEPVTADALMTILKLHAQGVDPALISEAVSTKEMRVSQKNVTDYVQALKESGWNIAKNQEDITS